MAPEVDFWKYLLDRFSVRRRLHMPLKYVRGVDSVILEDVLLISRSLFEPSPVQGQRRDETRSNHPLPSTIFGHRYPQFGLPIDMAFRSYGVADISGLRRPF